MCNSPMAPSRQFAYMDEASIDSNLMCSICGKPFLEPVCTPCDHTFCHECITEWIGASHLACPTCGQQSLSIDTLTKVSLPLRNILDQLRVKCVLCQQAGLQRGDFNTHTSTVCPKANVSCSAVDLKCLWVGPRDQLNNHLTACLFEPLRPMFVQLIAENQQLTEHVKNHDIEMDQHKTRIQELTNKISEIADNLTRYQNLKLEKLIDKHEPYSPVILDRQELTDQDMEIVVKQAIIKKRCTELHLRYNKITEQGTSILASALQNNTTLQKLYLLENQVSDKGAQSLAQVLSINNSTLKILTLGMNGITDEGVQHMAEMLKTNRTLTVLHLCENQIGDHGVQLLAKALTYPDAHLVKLYLQSNKSITNLSVDCLIDMLKHNQSMKELYIFDCNLLESGKTKLETVANAKTNFRLFTNPLCSTKPWWTPFIRTFLRFFPQE